MADDLNTPLGQTEKKRRFALRIPITLPQALVGVLGLVLGAFVLWTAFASDPYGGEPVAVVAATVPASPPAKTPDGAEAVPPKPGTVAAAAPPGDGQTVTIINGMSGKREQVVIPAGGQTEAAQQGADQRIVEWMCSTAEKRHIPYQREVLESGSTDAMSIQVARSGVLAGCLSIPCRYVHTPSEMVDYEDVQNSVKLMVALLSAPVNW